MTNEVIDLTGPLEAGMWRYDDVFPAFASEPLTSFDEDGFVVRKVTISTHMGTHTDALGHLAADAPMLDAIPLDRFIGSARVAHVPVDALTAIDTETLQLAAEGLTNGDIVLIRTGWDSRLHESDYTSSHPYLTLDAARWLIASGVKCIGMDTPGLMDPRIDLAPARRTERDVVDEVLLRADVCYVAGLVNLTAIRTERVWFVALPLKLAGLDGAPVRAIAMPDISL